MTDSLLERILDILKDIKLLTEEQNYIFRQNSNTAFEYILVFTLSLQLFLLIFLLLILFQIKQFIRWHGTGAARRVVVQSGGEGGDAEVVALLEEQPPPHLQ